MDVWDLNQNVVDWMKRQVWLLQVMVFLGVVWILMAGAPWLWWEIVVNPPEVLGGLLVAVFVGGFWFGKWFWFPGRPGGSV